MPRYTVKDLHDQVHDLKHHLDDRLDKIERHVRGDIRMATQAEQAAIDDLSAAVSTLATDLGGVGTAMQVLKDKIAALTAQGSMDAATISDLQASADDVVSKLSPITQSVRDIDAGLTSPATAASPLSAR